MAYAVALLLVYLLIVGMAAGWAAWIILGKSKALSKDGKANFAILLPLGIAGSLIAGLGLNLITGAGFKLAPAGMFASIAGAIAAVAIYQAVAGKR